MSTDRGIKKMFEDRPTIEDVDKRVKERPIPDNLDRKQLYWLLRRAELMDEWREDHLYKKIDELDAKDAELKERDVEIERLKAVINDFTIEAYDFYCKIHGYSCHQASIRMMKEWLDEKREQIEIMENADMEDSSQGVTKWKNEESAFLVDSDMLKNFRSLKLTVKDVRTGECYVFGNDGKDE
jgi:hypothetical protein